MKPEVSGITAMWTKILEIVFVLSQLQAVSEGLEFTYHNGASGSAYSVDASQACGVLQCTESISENSQDSRKLVGLTVYKYEGPGVPEKDDWKPLTTMTQNSPKTDILSDENRILGEFSVTGSNVTVQLFKAEECQSSKAQYSCVALLVDDYGRTTLMKSVLGGKIGTGSGPGLDCADSFSKTLPLQVRESDASEKVKQLVTSVWEKLKGIETRLEDFQTTDNRLENHLHNIKSAVIDKIHNLERTISDKLMALEMRGDDKIIHLKERLEDKLLEANVGESQIKISKDICLNQTLMFGEVIGSVQTIMENLTSIGEYINIFESAVTESVSKTAEIDRKLGRVVSEVGRTSSLTSRLVKNVDSLNEICSSKTSNQVDEYFDALGTGRKEWRLAFRGTAYNNVKIYPAYIQGTGIPAEVEIGCRQFNYSLPCMNHYRNRDALENWADIDEVLFAIYSKGRMVKSIIFNGRGSTFTNWFSGSRVKQSSWEDLTRLSHNIFSIEGDSRSHLMRRFLINYKYKGCSKDKGWFLAGDVISGGCPFERKLAHPMFLYAKSSRVALWSSPQQVTTADSVGVYIKYK